MSFSYHVHGLAAESQLPLPPLVPQSGRLGDNRPHSVQILRADLPDRLHAPEIDRAHYQATSGQVLMRAPGVGRLLISNGQRIEFELEAEARADDLAAHILGSGFANLHHQLGNVVLHASAVCNRGAAFLIAGSSGAGKSTIAAHLLEKGGATLGDDVCVIGDGPEFLVHPGTPSTKLADHALENLPGYRGLPAQGTCQSGKTIIKTASRFADTPMPLAGIVIIDPVDTGAAPVCTRLPPAQALASLRENTFRKRCITQRSAQLLFPKWSVLAQRVPMWNFARPVARDTREQIVDIVGGLIFRDRSPRKI